MSGQDLKVMLRRLESGAIEDDDALVQFDVAAVIRDLIASRARVAGLEAERIDLIRTWVPEHLWPDELQSDQPGEGESDG